MVDAIVRLTVLAVLALAALNALHAATVLVRLARHLARRQPHLGLGLWLPVFATVADVQRWLRQWRSALAVPALAPLRADARTVIGRHLSLALLSQTWAMAVTTLAPHLA